MRLRRIHNLHLDGRVVVGGGLTLDIGHSEVLHRGVEIAGLLRRALLRILEVVVLRLILAIPLAPLAHALLVIIFLILEVKL